MKYLQKMLMVAGALALTGIMAIGFAPKVAHGLAAATVQVVNTVASPAITQETNRQAAQILTLEYFSERRFI